MKKVDFLRKKYPKFVYQDHFYNLKKGNLEISFLFKIEPDICFRPKIVIKNVKKSQLKRVGEGALNNLVFHLGLMEIPSYWKATCSPEIQIEAGPLSMKASPSSPSSTNLRFVSINKEQIKWWKDLILKGMGQFFYENKIDWRKSNFLKINCQGNKSYKRFNNKLKKRYLVPLSGGKDSIVTLELLKKRKKIVNCFLVNPTKTTKNVVKVAGIKNLVTAERTIDSVLLKLNKKGYLNGHTPFTAVLSFLSVFCAVLFDYKYIAFSNEKSANEGNVKYLGKIINHQYSKSSEFERKFKYYSKKYLAKNVEYFSFLRKYNELEISKMFVKYPKYFSIFSSCNVVLAKKLKKKWCGSCPKCLFVYATLYPFLKKEQLLKIFGRDIFENKKLLPVMKSLIGEGRPKPFECVGTKKESRLALNLSLKKAKKLGKIPYLLTK